MKQTMSVVATVLLAVVTGALASTAAQAAAASPVAVEVTIVPAEGPPGSYTCMARISDPATGEVLSEPMVMFRSGEEARTRSGVPVAGQPATSVLLTVFADAASQQASVRVEMGTGNELALVQTVKIKL